MSLSPCRLMADKCAISVTFNKNSITLTQAGDWTERQKRAVARYLESEGFMDERADAKLNFKKEGTPDSPT